MKDPVLYRISANGKSIDRINGIFVFGENEDYWHITTANGYARTWKREELQIEVSCLGQETVKDRFAYLTALARVSELKNDDGDALLYNPVSKCPVLAIEVDGFHFHKDGTRQAQRDRMKDSILEKYGILLLRLPTNGSGEIEKIKNRLLDVKTYCQLCKGTKVIVDTS